MADLATISPAAGTIARVLRVPPEPGPPVGAHESIETFRGAPGLYRYQLVQWAAKQIAAGAGLYFGFFMLGVIPDFPFKWVLEVIEVLAVLGFLAMLPVTYLMVHLDYQLRWYIVTDRSLRIREGIVTISEKTMSFANIQNISVRQGPLQRLLGIADVEVRTAGGGAAPAGQKEHQRTDTHLGYFRGVDNAEQIRDRILARVRMLRDTGLGDPDAAIARHDESAVSPAAIDAARRLLDEVRGLRRALAGVETPP